MVTLSPVGLGNAPVPNRLSTLVTFKERLCVPFCTDSTIQPQVTVNYTAGTPVFQQNTVFVPIKAVITVVTQKRACGCNAHTQLFTENFVAAFQFESAVPTAVTVNSIGRVINGSNVRCGCAHSLTINDSLVITITPPTV